MAGRPQHISVDDRREQVVGKYRAAPDEPGLRAQCERRQPPLPSCVDRHVSRARADQGPQRAERSGAGARKSVGIRRVAREELVAAVAGQAHGHMPARQLRDEKRWNRRGVGERLVEVDGERFRNSHTVRLDNLFVMI